MLQTVLAAALIPLALHSLGERVAEQREHTREIKRELTHSGTPVLRAKGKVRLFSHPGGERVMIVSKRSDFGSERFLTARRVQGKWVGVRVSERPHQTLWVNAASSPVEVMTTRYRVVVDLSEKHLEVRERGKMIESFWIESGSVTSPTPPGLYQITDVFSGEWWNMTYGRLVFVLNGTQPNLPAGWIGGNRLAIHGTPQGHLTGSSGAGCIRLSSQDLEKLFEVVGVGTPVKIKY